MKILFATDLDSTLISQGGGPDAVVAGGINSKSYITRGNLRKIKELSGYAHILPVTARNMASYNILDLGVHIPYALVECGSILLKDGAADPGWGRETERIYCRGSMDKAAVALTEGGYAAKNRNQYSLDYRAAGAVDPGKTIKGLNGMLGGQYEVARTVSGIYVIHKGLNKGASLKRFLDRFHYDYVICAGDSEQDYPMMAYGESIGLDNGVAEHKFPASRFNENKHDFGAFVLDSAIAICKRLLPQGQRKE